MGEPHVVIVGGGLAGLATGCYARASGFRTTVVEHNLALGGVCTAWSRGPYVIDGCIHWLTGGPFLRLYEELGITSAVELRTLDELTTYRDVRSGSEIVVSRDLEALAAQLTALAPEDAGEVRRLVDGAAKLAQFEPRPSPSHELPTVRHRLAALWNLRQDLGTLVHYRKPLGQFGAEHLRSPPLRRFLESLAPPQSPAFFLLLMLGYLQRGWLFRPVGGTAAFRDALVKSYQRLGGEAWLPATVDEVLVRRGRARGVRLADGSVLEADAVVSTASSPETVLRLLGGRFGADHTRAKLTSLELFHSIVLASYGVSTQLAGSPRLLVVDGIEPLEVGGVVNDRLQLHVHGDDPTMAPQGHTVVQATLQTDYSWWATLGTSYVAQKEALAAAVLTRIEAQLPQVRGAVEVVDVATPLTFWNRARSWRGSYEGFLPSAEALFAEQEKTLPGLKGFYLAGQWVEPGGGVPSALASGRQVVEQLCVEHRRPFVPIESGR